MKRKDDREEDSLLEDLEDVVHGEMEFTEDDLAFLQEVEELKREFE